MGFWHTGYAEFHEPTGFGGFVYVEPPPIRYQCEFCASTFDSRDELRRHLFQSHPLRQPQLLLRGQPMGRLSKKLITPLQESEIAFEDADECQINGTSIPIGRLGQYLANFRNAFVDVMLKNGTVVSHFKLDFQVAKEADLVGVERAFLRLAQNRRLTLDDVSRFISESREYPTGMPYCNGICHYLYGVRAKEQLSDCELPVDKYVEYYLQATEELADVQRPLAQCIRAIVAFHFNHFDDAERWAPDGVLKQVASLFAKLLQGMPYQLPHAGQQNEGDEIADLLTDQATLHILDDASHELSTLRGKLDSLVRTLDRTPAGVDRLKRVLLTAEVLASIDNDTEQARARRLAREASAKSETKIWGETLLKRMNEL